MSKLFALRLESDDMKLLEGQSVKYGMSKPQYLRELLRRGVIQGKGQASIDIESVIQGKKLYIVNESEYTYSKDDILRDKDGRGLTATELFT